MKILFITSFLGNKGGLARYSTEVVKELRRHGQTVQAMTENNHPAGDGEMNVLVPVLRLSGASKWLGFIKNSLAVRRALRDFDVIHATDCWPYAIYSWAAVLGTKKKFFVTGMGTYTVQPLAAGGVKQWISRKAYLRASRIMCVSDFVRNKIIERLPATKTSIIPMGTTHMPVLDEKKMAEYKKRLGIEGQHPIVLTVGDIKGRKGQLDTLKGLVLLKPQYPQFLYLIVGSDGDTAYVSDVRAFVKDNNLSDNVRIISNMYDESELSFYYQVCDIFALNSFSAGDHFEGFGLVFLEAAQFGKPAIGSSGCGIESAIRDGVTGYLTRQSDPTDISVQIKKILQDKSGRLSKEAHDFYKEFSWDKTVTKYIEEYNNA